MPTYRGGCHCGALLVEFETAIPPAELPLRACSCTYCRRHGWIAATDLGGSVSLRAARPDCATRYRFGLGTCDFVLCRRCGICVAAVLGDRATVNLSVLDDRDLFTAEPVPITYDGETAADRIARRRQRWTPLVKCEGV